MDISAVIIGRKGSKRIPSKMWQKINNFSLIEWKIKQLKKTKVKRIYVGSDDIKLKKICEKYKVIFILRKNKYCDEKKTTPNEMVKNMLAHVKGDYVLWAHPTNPLISSKIYNKAINFYIQKSSTLKKNSLFSATKLQDHFWSSSKKPINYSLNSKIHVVAKKLKPLYRQNGGIFIRRKNEMEKDGLFVGKKPLLFSMDEISGWDINYPWELVVAKILLRNKKQTKMI